MKNKWFRILSLSLLLMLLAGLAMPGFAAAKVQVQKEVLWAGSGKRAVIMLNWPEGAKVKSIATADKSILKVGKQKGIGPNDLWMQPLKAGECKVTVTYTYKGKKKTASTTMQIKKYPNPFAWIKVNGKKISLTKNKFYISYEAYKKNSFTVTYKLNDGWKLEGRNGARFKGDDFTSLTWKKDKAVSLKGYTRACAAIDIRNKSTGDFFNYEIWFIR